MWAARAAFAGHYDGGIAVGLLARRRWRRLLPLFCGDAHDRRATTDVGEIDNIAVVASAQILDDMTHASTWEAAVVERDDRTDSKEPAIEAEVLETGRETVISIDMKEID